MMMTGGFEDGILLPELLSNELSNSELKVSGIEPNSEARKLGSPRFGDAKS